MTTARLSADWSPADTALRARMAALTRAATHLGSDISGAPRRRRKARFEEQARANFAAAYAQAQQRDPTYSLTTAQQEREIERMRQALLQRQMLELADRSAWSRGVDKAERLRKAERRARRNTQSSRKNVAPVLATDTTKSPRDHAIQAEHTGQQRISYGLTNR